MPDVEFRNIVKRFGSLTVLEKLNLKIADGEFLVLLGPSGCGKTTLLNMLAGLQETSDGTIAIGNRDVTDLDPKDRGLAMVFQSYALYPTKTVKGNLLFGLSAQKLDKAEMQRRVEWASKLLQIDALLDRKPAQLSGGQRQRVAIGRALVKNVDVFLFDEPLSNLDAKLRTEMRLEIKRLHNELKKTIVFVTHDQIEAMTMATRIAVMNSGVIQQIGTPDEIYERPKNLFVASFIGSPAMNMVPATVVANGGTCVARHEPSGVPLHLSRYQFEHQPKTGQNVIAGMRPEHFSVGEMPEEACGAYFELPVRYTEKTGSDVTAFLESGGGLIAVRFDSKHYHVPAAGERLRVSYPADKFDLFDPKTEVRI
ncbi:multiple sugar transport system ATP-binding protein [Rhizobium petrolearium]|uniref:ABC transporter ATP-binding protein n=1 Tax=Neorhizobium petrolearium TaxID=515361 RepID=UPI001AE3A1CB|nr:ABC transporter ATP-binding protein [Neorhizobium petrolearium]MBP1843947.1 multiple sugar transport system ATP-binding protein [Neorhizobium petrolearium]